MGQSMRFRFSAKQGSFKREETLDGLSVVSQSWFSKDTEDTLVVFIGHKTAGFGSKAIHVMREGDGGRPSIRITLKEDGKLHVEGLAPDAVVVT